MRRCSVDCCLTGCPDAFRVLAAAVVKVRGRDRSSEEVARDVRRRPKALRSPLVEAVVRRRGAGPRRVLGTFLGVGALGAFGWVHGRVDTLRGLFDAGNVMDTNTQSELGVAAFQTFLGHFQMLLMAAACSGWSGHTGAPGRWPAARKRKAAGLRRRLWSQ
jgi:hypothetical protein